MNRELRDAIINWSIAKLFAGEIPRIELCPDERNICPGLKQSLLDAESKLFELAQHYQAEIPLELAVIFYCQDEAKREQAGKILQRLAWESYNENP